MKQIGCKLFWVVLLFLAGPLKSQILPSFGDSRTGTAAMQFLKIAPDARSASMAGAVNAAISDVSSLYWNPAAITRIDSNQWNIQLGRTQYFANIGHNYAGAVYRISEFRYVGMSLISLNTGEMPVTTEFEPHGTGETFSANNLLLGLTYAQILTDQFSFGVTGKYAYEGIAGVDMHNGLFDFSFLYQLDIRNTKFAAGISNFGFNVSPEGEITLLTLNGARNIDNFESVSVPATFRLGAATDLVNKDDYRLILSAQVNHPTDNNETLAFGSEFSYKNRIFFRTGYEFGADIAAIPPFGFGIDLQRNFGSLRMDYGFENKNQLGTVHRLTVGIGIK